MISSRASHLARNAQFAAVLAIFSVLLVGCAGYAVPPTTPPSTQHSAAISVSPAAFNFDKVLLGQNSSQKLHVTNTGTEPLQITSLAMSNTYFVITGPSVPRTILPGLGLDYTVEFVPGFVGGASAVLTIGSNAKSPATTVKCAGLGEGATANLVISPSSISFGNEKLQSTATKNVTLQNTGDATLTVSGITMVGAGFGYSDLSPGFSLSPNQKVTFQIWFRPQVKGSASATVSFLSANLTTPASISLTGDGVTSSAPPPPPPPPGNGTHSAHLDWKPSTGPVAGYRVYRGDISGGPYATISPSLVAAVAYEDSAVTAGSTYYYVVTAVDPAGNESSYSNESAAAIP